MTEASARATDVEARGPFHVCAQSERSRVWAIPGSYPASLATHEAQIAEALIPSLERLLGVELPKPVDIVLVEPVPDLTLGPPGDPSERPVIHPVSPDGDGPPLSFVLADRVLSAVAQGPVSQEALVGLAVLADSRLGLAPPLSVIEAELSGEQDPLQGPAGWASLIAFTEERLGPSGVVTLLTAPRDESGLPPETLIEPWLKRLRSGRTEIRRWRRMLTHLRPFLRPHRWRLLELLSYMLLGLVFTIGLPLSSKYLVDGVLPSGSTRLLWIFVAVMAAVTVYHAGLQLRSEYANADVNLRIFRSLQLQIFGNLQRLSHDFYGRSRVGDIMSRLSSDLGMVQQTAGTALAGTISSVLTFVAAMIAITALSAYVGLAVLVVLPLIALAYRIFGGRLAVASLEVQERIGDTQSYLQQSLQAQEVTKAFRAEDRVTESFGERVTAQSKAALRLTLLGGGMGASIGLANGLPQLAIMGIGGYLVIQGSLTLGVLVALLGLVPSVFAPITALSGIAQSVRQTTGAMNRVVELLDEGPSVTERPDARTALPCTKGVRFSHVSFSYPTGRLVLDDVTLDIPAGSRVAVVGASGSGKSTLLALLVRFWDPTSGEVEIDGDDIRAFTLDSLRGQIGLVLQDTFVFDDTLRQNVAIGRPDATDEEIVQALQAAELTDFLARLPDGLDTRMGESTRASGGQRQRLAFARILLLDPSIIVLDEPTSALDSPTERAVLETLSHVARGRTTIMATHRLAAAVDADLIVVMEAGRVASAGTHDELMAAGGTYVRLYEEQTMQRARTVDMTQLEALRRSMLFGNASPEALSALAAVLEPERFDEGVEIFRQGDTGDRLFLVASGALDVIVENGVDRRTANRLRETDVFGELAVLMGGTRTATVRTTSPVLLWSLSSDALAAVLDRHAELRTSIEQGLQAQLEAYRFAEANGFAQPTPS
jgi:ABC-type multidrug transport system fused ATPase/permease subunit